MPTPVPSPETAPAVILQNTLAPVETYTPKPAPPMKPGLAIAPTAVYTPEPALSPTPVSRLMPVEPDAFELPIKGATGFTTVEMSLRSQASSNAKVLQKVTAGSAFRIIEENGAYWRVDNGDWTGWLAHSYCMINLPDVIPSIIYENTNASASLIRSSGKKLPGVTGKRLYDALAYNKRFNRTMYIMPALYSMAKKICAAQQAALSKGDSLKIYEAYRPYSAQRAIVNALADLASEDTQVKRGISTLPWTVSWFIAQNRSNHQLGCAIDVSLVKILSIEHAYIGDHLYSIVTDYEEYAMPSPIHELSVASVTFESPVSSSSSTAWKSAALSKTMNEAAISLQSYCTSAGLTPLASEWWHFNDLDSKNSLGKNTGQGKTELTQLCSTIP